MEKLNNIDAQRLLTGFYSREYKGRQLHDSPDKSRTSMSRRIAGQMYGGLSKNLLLGIGTGPQSIEKQLLGTFSHLRKLFDNHKFFTIDIADIKSNRLLAKRKYGVEHVRTDATRLPFANDTFGLVYSNHSIDFIPNSPDAFREAYRVLVPGGSAIFYFHHENLLSRNSEKTDSEVQQYWNYLTENQILASDEQHALQKVTSAGFVVDDLLLNSDGRDIWWEVIAHKVCEGETVTQVRGLSLSGSRTETYNPDNSGYYPVYGGGLGTHTDYYQYK